MEVGTDMSKFPDEKHFCSWLGLAPKHEISGGKVLKDKTLENQEPGRTGFPYGSSIREAGRMCLWRFLPASAGQVRSIPSHRGNSPCHRPRGLPNVEIPSRVRTVEHGNEYQRQYEVQRNLNISRRELLNLASNSFPPRQFLRTLCVRPVRSKPPVRVEAERRKSFTFVTAYPCRSRILQQWYHNNSCPPW